MTQKQYKRGDYQPLYQSSENDKRLRKSIELQEYPGIENYTAKTYDDNGYGVHHKVHHKGHGDNSRGNTVAAHKIRGSGLTSRSRRSYRRNIYVGR